MADFDLKLLDCTLRDGGYINNWHWGFDTARDIIKQLVKAKVDVVEVGFLRNVDSYDPDISVCNRIEELNQLVPEDAGDTMFSGMAMRSNYDIKKLSPYSGHGIEMIRITAHDYDIKDGMDFAREVKAKGYKLSINPINIMGYSDDQILWIIDQVNNIHPYQFSIVDTFGSMKRRDLDRIVSLVDNNLDRSIRVALHLHENMSMATCLAQNFIDKRLRRPVAVDGSLMGMGRIPGNLPIELISDYLNDYTDKNYEIDYMMDAIQDYISPLKGETKWGYNPAYFLSARFNLHRDYAEHYLAKGDLTNRDINHILARFDRSKATAYDPKYADQLYFDYKNNQIDDSKDFSKLKEELSGKNILLIAPGKTVSTKKKDIVQYIAKNDPVVISVNFVPSEIEAQYTFYSNNRRLDILGTRHGKIIESSNLPGEKADFYINYNRLSGAFEQGCNSLIMLMKLLMDLGIENICVAGADGYSPSGDNYYNNSMWSPIRDINFNNEVASAIEKIGINVKFITPSYYDRSGES